MVRRVTRPYRGPLRAVVLDWAGTTVDFGSFGPVTVFQRLFESRGVTISAIRARAAMGLPRKEHLRSIAQAAEVSQAWQARHGRPCREADVEAMFAEFIPMQMECLADSAEPIQGTGEAVAAFRSMGLMIGSTTGYTREMMEILAPQAARRGYRPDIWVCPDDVPAGLPYPWMIFLNAIRLAVHPLEALVKIGDTVVDIEEGLNAGTWTVGLAISGNALGKTPQEVRELPEKEIKRRGERIGAQFYAAGAHYVVDGIWAVPPVLEEILRRLAGGERP